MGWLLSERPAIDLTAHGIGTLQIKGGGVAPREIEPRPRSNWNRHRSNQAQRSLLVIVSRLTNLTGRDDSGNAEPHE